MVLHWARLRTKSSKLFESDPLDVQRIHPVHEHNVHRYSSGRPWEYPLLIYLYHKVPGFWNGMSLAGEAPEKFPLH